MKTFTFSKEVVLYATVTADNKAAAMQYLRKISRDWRSKLAEKNITVDVQSDWIEEEVEDDEPDFDD